ncbi:MAG: hypothetical protein ACYTGX_16025 [Planctomycetota bacterium]|jgi:hypothetical protein
MRALVLSVVVLSIGCTDQKPPQPELAEANAPEAKPAAPPAEPAPGLEPAGEVAQPSDPAAIAAAEAAKAKAEAEAKAAAEAAAAEAAAPKVRLPKEGGTDMAKMMKDSAQAPWMLGIHAGAQVGQYAITEMAGGTRMWWGVTGTRNGRNVVEMRMAMGGQGWITYAYVVDDEGNVQEAFIANYDPELDTVERGYAIKVMEKQEVAAGDGPQPEKGEELVNAAGRDWNCTWYKTEFGKTWMAEQGGWFSKIIKSEDAKGNVTMQLVEIGSDATLGLAFPEKK